ncbi:hypothetical protein G7085_03400 [Tessaracoccus sp. HDW20]|uniref:hypothetical protein n=1 Tax=Tessaracoccus coleopterorum TaxID=2714950 RepID=UPI0018D2860E|nr:hypothetical protein [Tessaracoccus coleopterorum]NHB84024.1 hypothetical protein [Tessaracoccus coleopterorum]
MRIALDSLERAAAATGWRWTVPAETAAALLITLTDGLTLTWLVSHDDALTRGVIDAAARAVAELARPERKTEVGAR